MLGPAEVGVFALAGAVAAPVLVLTQLQLRIVLATDVGHSHRLSDFLVVRSWSAVVLVVVVAVAGVAVGGPQALPVITVFGLAKAFDSVADVLYGYHQRREEMREIAVGQGVNGILSVVLFTTGIWATGSLLVGVVGFATGSAVSLAMRVVPTMRASRATDRDDPTRPASARARLVRLAAPLAGSCSSVGRCRVPLGSCSRSRRVARTRHLRGGRVRRARRGEPGQRDGQRPEPEARAGPRPGDRAGFDPAPGFGTLRRRPRPTGALVPGSWGRGLGACLRPGLRRVGRSAHRDVPRLGARVHRKLPRGRGDRRASLPRAAAGRRLTCVVAIVGSLLVVPAAGVDGAVVVTGVAAVVQVAGYAVVLRRCSAARGVP